MGIKNITHFKNEISWGVWPRSAIVSFDCQLFLWKIAANFKDGSPKTIAGALLGYLEGWLDVIGRHTEITKVLCYFDGIRPLMKIPTSNKRRFYTKIKMPKHSLIIDAFVQIPTKRKMDLIINRESEFEMFHNRNPKEPNILVSRDSDLLLVTVNHTKKTENDNVYVFDLRNLYVCQTKQPRSFNILLNILLGTDFNESIFSRTMVKALYQTQKYINFNIKTVDDLEQSILKLLILLRKSKFIIPTRKADNGNYRKFSERLLWIYNYYENYNIDFNYENFETVSSQDYLNYIIKKTYPNDDIHSFLRG